MQPSGPYIHCGIADSISWKTLHPLNINGCLIMKCVCGEIKISINSRNHRMKTGDMALFVFDMVAVPIFISQDFKAEFISLDFNTAQDIFFLITSNRFWDFIYSSPVFHLQRSLQSIADSWFRIIRWVDENVSIPAKEKVMKSQIENLMTIMADRVEVNMGKLGVNPNKNRAWLIVNDFLGLLNRFYAQHHDVAFYADKLNISPNYLNIIAKKNLGVSAKEQINIQLGLVIRMLLDTTDLSVKEIAERLNYDDPSYLCRIFRKHNGMSPIQYRNYQRSIHHPDDIRDFLSDKYPPLTIDS